MVLGIGSIILFIRIYLLDRGLIEVFAVLPDYLCKRIFETYTKAHAYIVIIFPDHHDYFNGLTFSNPGHIFPYDPINMSQFIGFWVSERLENYASPSFSQAYANFGIAGFILSLIIMFVQIIFIQIMLKKCPKTPLFLSIYVLVVPLMLGYSMQAIDAIIGLLFAGFIAIVILIYYTLNYMVSALFVRKHIKRRDDILQV